MPRALVLFSGTSSVCKSLKECGFEVISLDNGTGYVKKRELKQLETTHIEHILTWKYKQYPNGHFDFIFSSPPCTYFSCSRKCFKAGQNHELSYKKGDLFVQRTLKIISYFKPRGWALENPRTGELKHRSYMQSLNCSAVDYCQYAPEWGYLKPTLI